MNDLVKARLAELKKMKFNGFTIESMVERTNDDLVSITLRDLDGKVLHLQMTAYSDFSAHVLRPKSKKKVFRVEGQLKGVNVSNAFSTHAEAAQWGENLTEFVVSEQEVEVDE